MTDFRNLRRGLAAFAGALFLFGAAERANAVLVDVGQFSGNDCSGGAFANCKATTTGVGQLATGSPVIYKRNSDGSTDFGNFATITGAEFVLSFDADTHVLSWTYTPGTGDPEIHYFDIKQGNSYHLFYDLTSPITSFSIDLDDIGYNAFSHVTWFDTGPTTITQASEPQSLAVLGLGLVGLALYRRRRSAQRHHA